MTLEEIVDEVLLDVPDAPLATIREKIRWSARKFCTDADAWVSDELPVVFAANTDFARIAAPEGEPLRLVHLTIAGREVVQGKDYTQLSPTRIQFPRKMADSVIKGRLALRPSVGAMPAREVTDRWGEAFGYGARWQLLKLPKPWRDLDLAVYYESRFEAEISAAKLRSRFGYGRGSSRVLQRRYI